MKIGTIKVKRHYHIAQMVLDAVAVVIFVVIVKCVLSFGTYLSNMGSFVDWMWNLIWIVIAALVIVVSLLMIYLPRKMPKKYIVNNDNAQKYSDIVITAITCIRIPILLAVFEGMYICQSLLSGVTDGVFTLRIPLDILFSLIIIRFSIHRVRIIQPKPEDKSIQLKEN